MKTIPQTEDTIVALSTPQGGGAIAIIRLSGARSLEIMNPLLGRPIDGDDERRANVGVFRSARQGNAVDQVVTTYFCGPRSYTGEDVIEVSCHGNPLIINRIIEEIVNQGARVALPGEFTLRAFLNGKLDLSQAEAVATVIGARTRQSLTQSLRHLEGRFSEKIYAIKNDILNHLALLEINLDFSDEEIEVLPVKEMAVKIEGIIGGLEALLNTYDYGRLLQEGIKMLILGKPNVGKSSLLNRLLERERAIVSDIPGTTRDYIEASLELDGLMVQAVDTAGIRQTNDAVEAIGVERALQQLQSTDLALCMFDGHAALTADDRALLDIVEAHRGEVRIVLLLNKADLAENAEARITLSAFQLPQVSLSAITGQGIDTLKSTIKSQFVSDQGMESEEIVVTSARHKQALERTMGALRNALMAIQMKATEEIIAVDIRQALDCLGEITGETTSEDVVNHIFANFCIGK